MTFADEVPVCGACDDKDPFCCGGEAEATAETSAPDPVEQLLAEYAAVERDLWAALMRHQRVHGCGGSEFTCDLDRLLSNAWCRTRDESFAMRWVLGRVEMRFGPNGFPFEAWAFDYYCGPWPMLPDGTTVTP